MRRLTGTIVSNKMTKTVVVEVGRLKKHPKYLKYYKTSNRFKAHVDDAASYRVGDTVLIEETRPLSKDKRWKVVEVLKNSLSEYQEEANSSDNSEEQEP